MTKGAQQSFLSMLLRGKYRVDTEAGCVYSYRKGNDAWERLVGTELGSGFRQLELYLGKECYPRSISIYEHVAVYIAGTGKIPAGGKVIHRDGDVRNNKLWNLDLKVKDGLEYPSGRQGQILKLKDLWDSGERNHTRLAEAVLMDRQAVRRVCLKLAAGKKVDVRKPKGFVHEPWRIQYEQSA